MKPIPGSARPLRSARGFEYRFRIRRQVEKTKLPFIEAAHRMRNKARKLKACWVASYRGSRQGLVWAIDALTIPRSLPLLFGAVLLGTLAYCLHLFSPSFIAGTSPVWENARGLVGSSWADIPTALSGYFYFVRQSWNFPLFQIPGFGGTDGTNIIFTDSIPLVALLGRAMYCITGFTVNLYGAWIVFCLIASALSMTWLIALLGQRGIAVTISATVMALCMPALLFRWGHLSLMAHFEIVLALAFAIITKRQCGPIRCFIFSTLLCLAALWTNSYLFVMVSAIILASIGQALLDRSLRVPTGFAVIGSMTMTIFGAILVSGHLSSKASLADVGFGYYSMNLLSPISVQASGIFPARSGILDATGGQYEGFGYLGLGSLMLLLIALPKIFTAVVRSCRRYPLLAVLLAAFTTFALSNRIYIGNWEFLTVPLPDTILDLAGLFRSSGRFIWPVLYSISALVIIATARHFGRAGALLLLAASGLQWADTAPLRKAVAASAAAPFPLPLESAIWEPAIAQHSFVRLIPSYGCVAASQGWKREVAIEIQFLSSVAGALTNTVNAARRRENCDVESASEPQISPREMHIYLRDSEPFREVEGDSAGHRRCSISADLAVCSSVLDNATMQVLLQHTASNIDSKNVAKR
jgi:hypothetical protein